MRIALTGCSGFIGSTLAARFTARGDQVTGLLRSTSRRDHLDGSLDRVVEGSQCDQDCFDALLDGADVLVHNSVDWRLLKDERIEEHYQSNLVGSLHLLDEAARRNMHVVFMSSVAVHHHMLARWDGLIDSHHPTRPGNRYGSLKAAIESHLWGLHTSTNLSFAAIRPAAVYGQDPRIERTIGYPILRDIARGKAYERKGGGKFIHVDDVASATLAAADRSGQPPVLLHLAELYARWCDWADIACELLDTTVPVDRSSPQQPSNNFDLGELADAGVTLSRGMDGIREHLATLRDRMANEGKL